MLLTILLVMLLIAVLFAVGGVLADFIWWIVGFIVVLVLLDLLGVI